MKQGLEKLAVGSRLLLRTFALVARETLLTNTATGPLRQEKTVRVQISRFETENTDPRSACIHGNVSLMDEWKMLLFAFEVKVQLVA